METGMDYKVLFIEETDYSEWIYSKLRQKEGYVVISKPYMKYGKLGKIFYRIVFSSKLNSFFNVPFKTWWFDRLFNVSYDDKVDSLTINISATKYYLVEYGYIEYLRKKYHSCTIVLSLPDRYDFFKARYNSFEVSELKKRFDCVLSYNEIDVEKYGFILKPAQKFDFSDVPEDSSVHDSDVFFVGRDKGRLDTILSVFSICTKMGLSCDFNIVGVPHSLRRFNKQINYVNYMPYEEVLKHAKQSKCILNIMQKETKGVTLRDYEALGLGKIILSNNRTLPDELPQIESNFQYLDIDNVERSIEQLKTRIYE